jgi:hypothetical protein
MDSVLSCSCWRRVKQCGGRSVGGCTAACIVPVAVFQQAGVRVLALNKHSGVSYVLQSSIAAALDYVNRAVAHAA